MEHRVPRPNADPGPTAGAVRNDSTPIPALNPPTRNLSRRRLIRAGLVTGLTTAGLVLARLGWLRAERWLETRPNRRLPFSEIDLDPPPPKWIKGGTSAILAEVRHGSGLPESIDALAIPNDELRRAFRNHSHWVAEVESIRRSYPNHLQVAIRFREPVAEIVDRNARTLALLDTEAIVLPSDTVQRGSAGALLRIDVDQIPSGIRTGRAWPGPGQADDLVDPDPEMAHLCRLAGFLKQAERSRGADPIGFQQIRLISSQRRFLGIFLVASGNRLIRWRTTIEPESSPTAIDDDERWKRLVEWLQEDRPWPPAQSYLYFDNSNHGTLRLFEPQRSGGSNRSTSR